MSEVRISFILPCYNCGRFIEACLDSIFVQETPDVPIEVICINDCSTDNTREILEGLQRKHKNLILLDQPSNMYSGKARNRGLDVAIGDYIWFVDSDDMIRPDTVQVLWGKACADNLDILFFNYDEVSENGVLVDSSAGGIFKDTSIKSGMEFVSDEFQSRLSNLSLLWCRLLKRELVEKYSIRFSDLYITQDAPFAWETLLRAERVLAISSKAYIYRKNATSITARKPNARRSFTWSFGFPKEIRNVYDRLDGVLTPSISAEMLRSISYEVNQFPVRFLELDELERRIFYEFLVNDTAICGALVKEMNLRTKIAYYCCRAGYQMFKISINAMF